MDIERINQIVRDTTKVYRVGEEVERRQHDGLDVVEIYGYPPATDAEHAVVDMVFVAVEVDANAADTQRSDLMLALGDGIGPETSMDYRDGPSYMHIGADLGSQELALRFMALCSAVHLGGVVTPMTLGIEGPEAHQMAGMGLLYLTDLLKAAQDPQS